MYTCAKTLSTLVQCCNSINGPVPCLDRLELSTCQVLCLGATIVEQKDPYLTYLDDQWTPTADCQNMRERDKQEQTVFVSSEASNLT